MNKVIQKVIQGNPGYRKTRFHDEKGNLIAWQSLLLNGPRAALTKLQSVISNSPVEFPLIPYAAAQEIEKVLNSHSVVLEFGSGRSTIWLAKRCETLYSVDDNEYWFNLIRDKLSSPSLNNVIYELHLDTLDYVKFPNNSQLLFDLILIDGTCRYKCLENSINQLRPGGYVYIDDTDKHLDDLKNSEKFIKELVAIKGGEIKEYTDFSPEQLFVKQGILARVL